MKKQIISACIFCISALLLAQSKQSNEKTTRFKMSLRFAQNGFRFLMPVKTFWNTILAKNESQGLNRKKILVVKLVCG